MSTYTVHAMTDAMSRTLYVGPDANGRLLVEIWDDTTARMVAQAEISPEAYAVLCQSYNFAAEEWGNPLGR